jgi:hypothetical protein
MMINVWARGADLREKRPTWPRLLPETSQLMIVGIDHADPRPDLAIECAALSTSAHPQLADPDVVLRAELQIVGPPQTFFIRPDGTIACRHAGPFSSADEIRDLAQKYLGVTP